MTYCTDEAFALWAFGEHWRAYMMCDCNEIDLMHAWNKMHPEYRLKEDDNLIENMKKLWEKSR